MRAPLKKGVLHGTRRLVVGGVGCWETVPSPGAAGAGVTAQLDLTGPRCGLETLRVGLTCVRAFNLGT